MKKWTRAMYQPNLPLYEGHRVTASAEHITLSEKAAEYCQGDSSMGGHVVI